MKTPGTAAFLVAAGALVVPAAAENTWFFEVEYSDPAGVINSVDDTARVTLWAAFDAKLYAFASSELNLAADDPRHASVWSYLTRILKGPGTRDGTAVDGTVYDIGVGQLHFPSAGIFADTSNPIAAWTALWQTEDLHPRSIPLSTATATFNIYIDPEGTSKDFIDTIVESAGAIHVVPTPSAAPLLGMGLLAARRRRARVAAAAATLALAATASASNAWLFEVTYSDPAGVINSAGDTATVTLWAEWSPEPPDNFAFAIGQLSVTADDPLSLGVWSDPKRLLKGPGSKGGTIDGESVTGIRPTQWFDAFANIFPDDSNPIAAWTATWHTSDLQARDVSLSTMTTEFKIWQWSESTWDGLPILEEGAGVIVVVPAPAASVVPALLVLAAGRHR